MAETPAPYKVGDPIYRDGEQIGTVTAVTSTPATETLYAGWEITVTFSQDVYDELYQDIPGLSVYGEDPK